MTREEAKEFLINISYQLGNMGVEYLTTKDGEKMRAAIKTLEQEIVIDKMRVEVENINPWAIRYAPLEDRDTRPKIVTNVKSHVLEIIDKYKENT